MDEQNFSFLKEIDDETLKQFESCKSEDFVVASSLMPDVHSGYVAPIGSVFITKNYLIPAWVGYDIGCGVSSGIFSIENSNKKTLDLIKGKEKEIFSKVLEKIPMGKGKLNHIQNISSETKKEFKKLFLNFINENPSLNQKLYYLLKNKALSNLGTLGSGNHFIELGKDEEKNLWIVVHSGSRNIGHQVATYFMEKAAKNEKNIEGNFKLKYNSKEGLLYQKIVNFCLEFAKLNRLEIINSVREILETTIKTELRNNERINFKLVANNNHNYIEKLNKEIKGELKINLEKKSSFFIHRKGAISAKNGELAIIPANMKIGCFLVRGKQNSDFLFSASHGAGRKLSRKVAKEKISLKEFKNEMKDIISIIDRDILDEAPAAYKDIEKVLEYQKDSIEKITHIAPIINWKGK